MDRLIHLNGPRWQVDAGRRFADDHPGALALDVDEFAERIDGWREIFFTCLGDRPRTTGGIGDAPPARRDTT